MAKNMSKNNSLTVYPPSSEGYRCDSCGKIMTWNDEKAAELERPKPGTKPDDWEYYIPCPLCKTGSVQQPEFSLAEALDSILNCEE